MSSILDKEMDQEIKYETNNKILISEYSSAFSTYKVTSTQLYIIRLFWKYYLV